MKEISKNIKWDSEKCKYCNICIEICPTKSLMFNDDNLKHNGKCIKCKFCEKYCPDFAIEVMK